MEVQAKYVLEKRAKKLIDKLSNLQIPSPLIKLITDYCDLFDILDETRKLYFIVYRRYYKHGEVEISTYDYDYKEAFVEDCINEIRKYDEKFIDIDLKHLLSLDQLIKMCIKLGRTFVANQSGWAWYDILLVENILTF